MLAAQEGGELRPDEDDCVAVDGECVERREEKKRKGEANETDRRVRLRDKSQPRKYGKYDDRQNTFMTFART